MLSACNEKPQNIFLQEWDTPYGTAPFSKITPDQYMPAFQAGLEEQKANIEAIVKNTEAPTFENTIEPFLHASPILDKVQGVFFNLAESDSTPEMQDIEEEVTPLITEASNEILMNEDLFARVTNPKNYNRNYAALDNALNQIVNDKKRAVFVTDGELFSKDGGESELPWAREGFAKWLKDGNKLSFYVTDFIEKKKKKHVFYMIFTPADEIGSKADVTDALEYALKNMQVPGSELKYVSFHFQNNAFGLEKGFSGKAPGSLSGDLEVMEDSYALNSKGNWEYADVALNWSGIYTYFVENAVSEKTGKPIKGGYPLIGKRENSSQSASLALNATALEFYKVNSVKLRVKDIHDDFMSYATEAKCLQNPQEVKKRDNGEVEIDPETEEPIIIKEGEPGCFDGKGNLLPEFKYSPKPAKVVTDVFVLNTDHFNETMMHNAKGEIEIQLAPNFEETSALTCDECSENFLKLELIVDDVVPVTSNPNLQNFIWEGQKLPTNKAMYESVIMALRDAIPQGKVLYTWYIKAPFNDFK